MPLVCHCAVVKLNLESSRAGIITIAVRLL